MDDIANALDSYFKAHYPTSDFTSALKQLTQVRDAEDRGDRRAVEDEMDAFFTMLTNANAPGSLKKWRIEEGWILCRMDGLQCSINCPQFKRSTTICPSLPDSSSFHHRALMGCMLELSCFEQTSTSRK